jgi:hypothetical protein
MPELEIQPTGTGFSGKSTPEDDANGIGAVSAPRTQTSSDSDDDRPVRGVSVIPIPRREIARLKGTLRLSELPRHKPIIVFDAGRQFRDIDNE